MKRVFFTVMLVIMVCVTSACVSTERDASAIYIPTGQLEPYYPLDVFDLSEIQLVVLYRDGGSDTIALHETMLRRGDAAKLLSVGEHEIEVRFGGQSTRFTVVLVDSGESMIDFYYLNDLHGEMLPGPGIGMAYIGNLFNEARNSAPDSTVILAGGDILQGALISNYDYGETLVELMDMVGFDAAVAGNHEFDWGLDMVTRYYLDEDETVYRAQHPFLGANIVYEGTTIIPEGIEPYTVLEKGDITIGVIGTIGYGLESSISYLMAEPYEFLDPVPIARNLAQTLRVDYQVDMVVLLTHDTGNTLNAQVRNFTGDERIDIIFNGHSHREEISPSATVEGGDTLAIQSGGYGSHVGHVRVVLKDGEVVRMHAHNLTRNDDERLRRADAEVEAFLNIRQDELAYYYDTLLYAEQYISRADLAAWMADLMLQMAGADVGVQNLGGTRHDIDSGEAVSLATLLAVFPFPNQVMRATISGDDVTRLASQNIAVNTVGTIHPSGDYVLATTDFLFFRESSQLRDNNTAEVVFTNMQQLVIDELLLQAETYHSFDTNNPLLLPNEEGYGEDGFE